MKARVDQATADVLVEVAELPDQLVEQSTFRLKRRVKGLQQVVSDLELPVASTLSLKLQCTTKSCEPLPHKQQHMSSETQHEQVQQQQALQASTQVRPSGGNNAARLRLTTCQWTRSVWASLQRSILPSAASTAM